MSSERIFEFDLGMTPTEYIDYMIRRVHCLKNDFHLEEMRSPEVLFLDAITYKKFCVATKHTNVYSYCDIHDSGNSRLIGLEIRVVPVMFELILLGYKDNQSNTGMVLYKRNVGEGW